MRKLFFLLALSLPFVLNAQRQPVGNLTVFSEDGDKFYLILNGEKQNDAPQTNIRIEELPQPYYNAKIIFKDSTLGTISKSNLYIASPEGVMMDVTYRIRKDKAGKVKLNYYSMIPVPQEFAPPAGMYVHHFGQATGTTQTTTTSTSNTLGANMNVNGVNLNVTISDPTNGTTTTTTTTTSSTGNTGDNYSGSNSNSSCSGWPMGQSNFAAAKKTVAEASFEESKLSTAKSVATANCLSTDQVVELCKLFGFEDSKLAFAKFAYKHTTDPKNYFKVNNVFSFDSSKDDLNKFLSGE